MPAIIPPEKIEAAHQALEKTGSKRGAARELGVPESTLRHWLSRAVDREALPSERPPAVETPEGGFIVKENTVSYDKFGDVARQTVKTTRAPGEVFETPAGHQVKGVSAFVDAEGRLIGKWIKTRENAERVEALITQLEQSFAQHKGQAPVLEMVAPVTEDYLTVYLVPDLHMGLYAWGPESGDDYDTDIATTVATKAIARLVGRSVPSKHAVLLINGDFFHQNDQKNATPRSGHRLDVDGRWDKVYTAGVNLVLALVDLIQQRHDQIELVIIPGNHDEDAAITLRVALKLYFSQHPRVQVYGKPGLFWYRLFGTSLLGAMHGHNMRDPKDMALTMSADCSEAWGKAQFRQIWSGHIHHERAREVGPVRWESFHSPAPTDGHAHGAGYRSGRSLTAITIHIEDGELGRHRQPILPRTLPQGVQ